MIAKNHNAIFDFGITACQRIVFPGSQFKLGTLTNVDGNQANENERAYIRVLKDKMQKGDNLVAKMTAMNGKMVGYYPIVTNAMCLQCHGNKDTDITSATYEKIKKLYPSDKATGYRENEVRGLWVVEMEKDKNQR